MQNIYDHMDQGELTRVNTLDSQITHLEMFLDLAKAERRKIYDRCRKRMNK